MRGRNGRGRIRATIVGIIGTWVAAAVWTLTGNMAFTVATGMTFVQIWFLTLVED